MQLGLFAPAPVAPVVAPAPARWRLAVWPLAGDDVGLCWRIEAEARGLTEHRTGIGAAVFAPFGEPSFWLGRLRVAGVTELRRHAERLQRRVPTDWRYLAGEGRPFMAAQPDPGMPPADAWGEWLPMVGA